MCVRKGGAAFVSGERGVPAGGAGEHQEVLLDGEDYHEAGVEYSFENKDIVKGSRYASSQCCGSTELELGTVYAAAETHVQFLGRW